MKTMKKMKTLLKEQTGFTLVELMVVVAIIGVLSAVAVPNFKKYQAKAKTSEAKVQLAAAYTAMHSFYADFGMFAGCLSYMGYNPATEKNNRYYAVGFHGTDVTINQDAYDTASNSGLALTSCPKSHTQSDGLSWFSAGKGAGGKIVDTGGEFDDAHNQDLSVLGTQAADAHTFVIGAAGSISGESNAANSDLSSFSINENKFISIHYNGY